MDTTAILLNGRGASRSAFEALYGRLQPRLYVWASLRIPRPLWARLEPEDLVQETWLRAMRALGTFDPARGSFRAWLFGIAAHTLAELLRRLAVRRRETAGAVAEAQLEQLAAAQTSLVRGAVRAERLRRFATLAAALPGPDRQLLLLRGIEGRPHGSIAAGLGISSEAAEMRWRRLLARLRAEWGAAGLTMAD